MTVIKPYHSICYFISLFAESSYILNIFKISGQHFNSYYQSLLNYIILLSLFTLIEIKVHLPSIFSSKIKYNALSSVTINGLYI